MDLVLYSHPLASFCHKVLIALYDAGVPFRIEQVDGRPAVHEALLARWPIGKMPVLIDAERDVVVPETTIILEWLTTNVPAAAYLLPRDPDAALDARLWERFFDLYVQHPLQKIVGDRLRPSDDARDAYGVAEARATLRTAYGMLATRLADEREWIGGTDFTIADCSAAPALFYAGMLEPFPADAPQIAAYLERLLARPAVARTYAEAQPWFHLFPYLEAMPARWREPGAFGTWG